MFGNDARTGRPGRSPGRFVQGVILLLVLCLGFARAAQAHTEMPTLMLVTIDRPGHVTVKIDGDLTLYLGSAEAYYAFSLAPQAAQQQRIRTIVPRLLGDVQFLSGTTPIALTLDRFTAAKGDRNEFVGDTSATKLSTFEFGGALPAGDAPIRLRLAVAANVDFPIALTVRAPAKRYSATRWLVSGDHESEAFDWANAPGAAPDGMPPIIMSGTAADEDGSWRQIPQYLYLGFRHIVPEGTDHILFVLGLFFLGISWRKLLTQTTVFTIAHATTLFLSTYGIFRLPSAYVEPLIALSISVIAIENVFRPNLGIGRIVIVFCFGLIHGLGFAASLADVPFPKHDFVWALLGFNFGVDLGQLFVMSVAFLLVGWFRYRPWYRARIAIPVSLIIAAIGLYWAVERVITYRAAYF